MKDEHNLIGTVVIIAVLLASFIGVFLIFKQPYGRAFQIPGLEKSTECACRMNGLRLSVFYSESGYVMMPDGFLRNVGEMDKSRDVCAQVCGAIGGYRIA